MKKDSFYTELINDDIIQISGEDAHDFLQGQLTCNMHDVSNSSSTLAAFCNPKGRIITTLLVIKKNDKYFLVLNKDLIAETFKNLKKYAIFSKVELKYSPKSLTLYGLTLNNDDISLLRAILPNQNNSTIEIDGTLVTKVNNSYYIINDNNYLNKNIIPIITKTSYNEWYLTQIFNGFAQTLPSTSSLFIPQMINLQNIQGVSFSKGCYTGQEIIARMQYLGKLKRKLYTLKLNGENIPLPGEDIYEDSKNIGTIAFSAQSETQVFYSLCVLNTSILNKQIQSLTINNKIYFLKELVEN